MRIGIPKEIKNHEYRVGLTPSSVRELTLAGHEVVVQAGAGGGIGADDGEYQQAGARIVADADQVFGQADMVKRMRAGAVVVDVAIDQGGCFETSRPTTHAQPTYLVDDVVHYCVANMPGGVPRTSTYALNNATLPFVMALANQGWQAALRADPHLRKGLNVAEGQVTCDEVATALGYAWQPPEALIGA